MLAAMLPGTSLMGCNSANLVAEGAMALLSAMY